MQLKQFLDYIVAEAGAADMKFFPQLTYIVGEAVCNTVSRIATVIQGLRAHGAFNRQLMNAQGSLLRGGTTMFRVMKRFGLVSSAQPKIQLFGRSDATLQQSRVLIS